MPIYANRIVFGEDSEEPEDYYAFEDMVGRLQPKAQQMEISVRPGFRGETFRKTGVRAIPSQIVTMHYVADWQAAADALVAYNDLIDGNPKEVIQHSTSYGYFRIASVVEHQVQYIGNVIGSILEATEEIVPTVQQYIVWTLISTDPPEEP